MVPITARVENRAIPDFDHHKQNDYWLHIIILGIHTIMLHLTVYFSLKISAYVILNPLRLIFNLNYNIATVTILYSSHDYF